MSRPNVPAVVHDRPTKGPGNGEQPQRAGAPPRRDHGRRPRLHRLEAIAALVIFCLALLWAFVLAQDIRRPARELHEGLVRRAPASAADGPQADLDEDGLADAEEDALLARFAPRPLLAPDDPSLPANVGWIRARTALSASGPTFMGAVVAPGPFTHDTRRGSRDPADWTVYGHAYARADGGVELQYWFYFPYNEGPLFFDHESDWEHVSVELGPDRLPRDLALAAHNHNAPGRRVAWKDVARTGNHPFFLVAAGTHAAYLEADGAPFWERFAVCPRQPDGTPDPGRCQALVWRPGEPLSEGGSPLVNVGERGHVRPDVNDAFFMTYAGFWGAAVPVFGSAAPYGPPYQRGFCVDARAGTCR